MTKSFPAELEIDILLNRTSFKDATRILHQTLIAYALEHCKGNKSQAARMLGLKRTTLNNIMKRLAHFEEAIEYLQ